MGNIKPKLHLGVRVVVDLLSVTKLSLTLVDCDHIGWKSWKLVIARTQPNTFPLCSPKAIHLIPGEQGEILGETRDGVGKSGVLKHKSGNISETRTDRGKVTMEGL